MCKAAVGRSFCCSSADELKEIPEGYQSLFIDEMLSKEPPYSLAFCSEESIPASVEYVIKDRQLLLPLYLVEVEWDPQEEKRSRQTLSCENCEKAEAVMYCQADTAHLCALCDKEIHASKLASRHSRMPLEKGLHCIVNCRLHPERLAEFFCPTCHVVVCLSCKMIGHHSSGDAAEHPLVSVPEAYASVVSASNSPDPIIDEGRKSVLKQFNRVQAKAEVILSNASQIREQLSKAYNLALADLDQQIAKKLRVLRGDAFLFGRLLQGLGRSAEFLRYLKVGRDAPLFLLSWHHYLQAKVSMSVIPAAHSSAVARPTDPSLCPDTLLELKGYFSINPINSLAASSATLNSQITMAKSYHSALLKKVPDQQSEGADRALFSHH
ncbi:hypothetical protein DI09_145p30 [Mitosporidium daphniae]|uniref:B box-type domain-containing protein n=1 Tax=Mitosporidium daphniae TaxID=1485682 RepID=A0A098VU66_9MICR|nr:uncharacterized protein DI09_145p30 [Mitosporidium daphniae]KGG52673.1 hypothetical protein DI09_145p30 [Mitosporidium daphniae]|eukprot:XP_013239109.1 uncharacterized protein DI09_145p30 [Mitosporidium daphniae]